MGHVTGPASADADGTEEASNEDGPDGPEVSSPDGVGAAAPQRTVPLWMAATLVVLALVGGFLVGRPSYPLDTGADAGFLRDMSAHHAQAVDMSLIIIDKTEDVELHTVATDMARTQQAQIGMMQGWLTAWGLNSRSAEPPMAWMEGHEHGGGEGEVPETMPGLATSEELVELNEAEGVEAEVLFLELMIAHHIGGVEMAEAEVDLGNEELVTNLAQGMIDAQLSEVENMERMIELRE
ncbi:DUF305 domain-containing protein [Nocardiopsis terrae]